MATFAQERLRHVLMLADDEIAVASDPILNESIEQMTQTVQVELYDTPTLAPMLAAELQLVDPLRDAAFVTFAGEVDHISATSDVHKVTLTLKGPLGKLRRCSSHDRPLTGMTDGEAVAYVLDLVEIDHDPEDIADCGYLLGARLPVYWHKDQSGWEIVRELDRVFGCATVEVGRGRVVRFPYDLAPGTDRMVEVFEHGVDADFFAPHARDRGPVDAIQNVWHVTGATWEASDGCRLTPWARAEDDNALLGPFVNVRTQAFSSEFVQDESLAVAIARRMRRWHNRLPDNMVLVTQNHPRRQIGAVVGVTSAVYGIDHATVAPYVIAAADRQGDTVTLTLVGGAAGTVGTITRGTERVCNRSTSTVPGGAYATPPLTVGGPASGDPYTDLLPASPPAAASDVCTGVEPGTRSWSCGTTELGAALDWTATDGAVTGG